MKKLIISSLLLSSLMSIPTYAYNTGWYKYGEDGGNTYWCYTLANGQDAKGWQQIGGKWYYFFPMDEGAMTLCGWHQIGGQWYYFDNNGAMAQNKWIGNYYVNSNGVWQNNSSSVHSYSECLDVAKAYFSNSHMSGYKFTTNCNQKLNASNEYHFEFYSNGSKVDGCYVNASTKNVRSD